MHTSPYASSWSQSREVFLWPNAAGSKHVCAFIALSTLDGGCICICVRDDVNCSCRTVFTCVWGEALHLSCVSFQRLWRAFLCLRIWQWVKPISPCQEMLFQHFWTNTSIHESQPPPSTLMHEQSYFQVWSSLFSKCLNIVSEAHIAEIHACNSSVLY